MAKRTVVQVLCDSTHIEDVFGQTVTVTQPDGSVFQVDLCGDCLTDMVGPLERMGRVLRKPGRRPRK